jgi:hypothetical protein
VIGDPAEESGCSLSVPSFVLTLIEQRPSSDFRETLSFVDIFETLKVNDFQILEGVDWTEVSKIVSWIEFSEALTE